MIVDKTGKMNIDFSYEDLSDADPEEQMIIWEYEQLGLLPKSNYGREFLHKYLKERDV